jgi:hypothetical protein
MPPAEPRAVRVEPNVASPRNLLRDRLFRAAAARAPLHTRASVRRAG